MIHKVYNARQEEVGFWDDKETPRTYHTDRNYKLRQIFIHPKYENAVGLDIYIIEKVLNPNEIKILDFLIINFEKESFHAIVPLNDFLLMGKEINFDKEKKHGWRRQIILPLNKFTRVYGNQKRLVTI